MMVFLLLAVFIWLSTDHNISAPWYVWLLWAWCLLAKLWQWAEWREKHKGELT